MAHFWPILPKMAGRVSNLKIGACGLKFLKSFKLVWNFSKTLARRALFWCRGPFRPFLTKMPKNGSFLTPQKWPQISKTQSYVLSYHPRRVLPPGRTWPAQGPQTVAVGGILAPWTQGLTSPGTKMPILPQFLPLFQKLSQKIWPIF